MSTHRGSAPTIWWALVFGGIVSIVAGVLAIAYPKPTLLVLALITGINLMILSAIMIAEVFSQPERGDRTLRSIVGILGIVAGIVIVRRPGETLLVVILVVGLWLIAAGLVELVRTIVAPTRARWLGFLAALVDLILGVLILSLPDESLKTVAILAGISFIVRGLFMVLAGFAARAVREERPAPVPAQTPSGA